MKNIIQNPILSTTIFFILVFLIFASQHQLFDKPGDAMQWLVANTTLA